MQADKKIWRSIYSLLIVIFFMALPACQQKENPEVPGDEPLFDIETGDSQIPYVVIDTRGVDILNEPKISGEMRIFQEKIMVQEAIIGIEYRGSTSYRLSDKKSFGIETWDENGNDEDVSFFEFPPEEDWILMGHVVNLDEHYIFDRTLMYHYFGYQLSRKIGKYASRCKFVELELNGDYQGVYVFMEKLKRDRNRIDISSLKPADEDPVSITGGYILKIDKTAGGDLALDQPLEYYETNWDDDARYTIENSFRSSYDIYGNQLDFEPYGPPYHSNQYLETYFLYEYPDAEDITNAQKQYIQDYLHDFETALLTDDFSSGSRTYTEYIDHSSFVDYFILNELCRNVDAYRLSTYLQKDREGKLAMGPIWDLNIGYDSGDRVPLDGWVINYNEYVDRDAWMMPFWWPRLMEDPIFTAAIKARWEELRSGILSTSALLDMVDETADYLKSNGAIQRNYSIWDAGLNVNYDESIQHLKSFLEQRSAWMDAQISLF
jgi:hypothetical protein